MTTFNTYFRRLVVVTAAISLPFAIASAQSNNTEDDQDRTIEEIIVTGTAGGAEIRKFDASFAITTVNDQQIEEYSPNSTADLLKLVPGVWSESSGGVSGANVFVRGFPGGGDAPYLTVQLQGVPIYSPPTLSFLENTTLFRLDETVMRMEALRGGPNPVFSNGQPGLTTNFILREGSAETQGKVKYSTSDYQLRRFDGYISGEISDEFYYMIGGYISSSPGIRDSGFNSDEGQQFTINLTKDLDNGSINIFHRSTKDHGTWYLPVALNVPGVDNQYNQIGTLNRLRQIQFGPNNETQTVNLGDGRGWDGSVSGGSVNFEIADSWELNDRFGYTSGNADTLGLVPDGGAIQISALRADPTLDPLGVITAPVNGITGASSGRAIAESEYIQRFGAWEVLKNIESFTNDLSLAKTWDGGTVTVGYYAASSSVEEFWSLGNHKYEVVQVGGEVVDGIACNDPAVDSCNWGYDINASGDATTNALYAAGTFDLMDRLTVDVGMRVENHQVNYSVDEGLVGQISKFADYDKTKTSWTVAGNYQLNDSMGAFARINSGNKMPYFDDFRDIYGSYTAGNDLIAKVDQYELGFKWVTDNLSLYATGFHTKVDPVAFVPLTGVSNPQINTQESNGVELDGAWASDSGFMLTLNATVQKTKIIGGPDDGNETQRQPKWQMRLSPSYSFETGDFETSVYGTIIAVGDRWSEPQNVNKLDGYTQLDLGVLMRINEAFSVQLAADNIADKDALTEGDPRTISAPNGRYIMPRTLTLSFGYEF